MRALGIAALLAVIAGLGAGPSAQGLADVARRTASAPPQAAAKKYTNDDVEPALPASVATPAVPEATAEANKDDTAKTEGAGGSGAAEEVNAPEPEVRKTPEFVVNRLPKLKAQIETKEKQLRDLQARGSQSEAAQVMDQIATLRKELTVLEARVVRPAPAK